MKNTIKLLFAIFVTALFTTSHAQEAPQNQPAVEVEVNESAQPAELETLPPALDIESHSQELLGSYETLLEKYNLDKPYLGESIITLIFILLTFGLIFGARLGTKKLMEKTDAIQKKYSIKHKRFRFYINILKREAYIIISLLLIHMIGVIWDINFLKFLQTDAGVYVIRVFFRIAILTTIVVALWEIVIGVIDFNLNKAKENEVNRWQTLLPIARNIITIIFALLLMFLVLPELGIDVVPLLASFGIFGLAIAFGAQTLVRDFITGFIIISEDLVNVGDVVTVGGKSGFIEKITIRKIQMRDFYGTVYTVPFSKIDITENFTKEFSFFLTDVCIAYKEDPELVAEYLKEIDKEIKQVDSVKDYILEPMEIYNIDKFTDSAIVLKVRIKTKPIWQWAVGREFNRLLKRKFDEKGVEIPFPHRTIYFGESKPHKTPEANHILKQRAKTLEEKNQITMDEASTGFPDGGE